ncbi:hypothetical protein OIU84_021016 [Salix udensis]|uniref:X8 domain-containing protein n=1 Tax=Salix udensis TaxID=889485 RepID=A0AAD6PH27_9ROSI|nr:hypothetical protein OIU84_021016 [Salix udensis]
MAVLVFLVVLWALTGHSSATYCICKDGIADAQLQKALDYACGAGADCTQILQTGPCYQPNTHRDRQQHKLGHSTDRHNHAIFYNSAASVFNFQLRIRPNDRHQC